LRPARVLQKIFERAAIDQFAAALAAAGTDVDEIIGRANDLFLVFDHQQRVPFVAQVVHDADEAPHIARMQADTRFVHDEQCIDERRAQTGCQIYALDFATAKRARRSIEREITDADFAEITQARTDFVAQHLRGRVARRDVDLGQEIARIGD